MFNQIRRSSFFLIIFFITINMFTYILRPDGEKKQRFAGFYYQPKNTIDVIYIGSSPVQSYWAAPLAWKEEGFTSWQMATDVQQPKAALPLLKEIQKRQSPKVVIFEMRMFTKTQKEFDERPNIDGFIRNVTDNMKISRNRIETINILVPDIWERYNYYFDIIKYHLRWKQIKESDYEYWNLKKEDIRGGHYISSNVMDLSKDWHDYSSILEEKEIPFEQEIVLREILRYCREKNITALFTVNPYTDITEDQQKMFNYMEKIVSSEYRYNFINFNNLYDELDVSFDMDFYNGGHMNVCGGVKFTRYLADYLVRTYELGDKRGGTEYSNEWDAIYESWKEEAEEAIAVIEQKVKNREYDE